MIAQADKRPAPRRVGRYEVIREVGRGGMAVVHLAWQPELERHVALKELAALHAADHTAVQRFLNESRLAGSLSHPNIITVYDFFEHREIPYIAMEYLERQSLRPLVGDLTLAQCAGVLEGLLAALDYAAAKGVVHRDLKPENVLITSSGRVKIADFGIAKAYTKVATTSPLTGTQTTMGTPVYMSPEQAMGKGVGPAADLYSVGVMAYELLVGRVPFQQTDTPLTVLLAHVNEPLPDPRELDPTIDPRLVEWLERMLAKTPDDRFADAQEAWDELEGVVIDLLGARWRRDARLPDPTGDSLSPPPAEDPEDVADPVADEICAADEQEPERPRREPGGGLARTVPPRKLLSRDMLSSLFQAAPPVRSEPRSNTLRFPRSGLLPTAVVIAAVLGYLLSGLGAPSHGPAPRSVSNGEISAQVPPAWLRLPADRETLAHGLVRPVVLAPRGTPGDSALVLGQARGRDAMQLPAELGATGSPPRPDRVRLGRVAAYRFDDLTLRRGDRRQELVVFSVPTSDKAAVVACRFAPAAPQAVRDKCLSAANSLRLLHARPRALEPSVAYARGLTDVMRTLSDAKRAPTARLAGATTSRAQAEAARELSDAYKAAAGALSELAVAPETTAAHDGAEAALRRAATAYRGLANAARTHASARYAAGRSAVHRADAQLRRALRRFSASGYAIR